MAKNFRYKEVLLPILFCLVCLVIIYLTMRFISKKKSADPPNQDTGYVIFAENNTGMHCYQSDYSGFLILPPGNNIKVQVFKNNGETAELINSGIDVTYQIIDNTTSLGKTNFWDYAKDYGYDVAPDIGITGNGLTGSMQLSGDGNFYEITSVPVTPYNDGSKELNPYQLAVIKVIDSTSGKELAVQSNVVVPVSDEMDCYRCHGTNDTSGNILKAHDRLSGTTLVQDLSEGKRYKCSECHSDNILEAKGKPDIPPLSQAMHDFHSDKMEQSPVTPACYNCHPGPVSQCYRSVMLTSGVGCITPECHGDMANIASSQVNGRKAWLEEPDCGNCHDNLYGVNKGKLYINSYLINSSSSDMNGFILCESCHNSPHAEWKSKNPKDNLLPISLQGFASFIRKCSVCHEASGRIHEIKQPQEIR